MLTLSEAPTLTVDPRVFDLFPGYVLAAVWCSDLQGDISEGNAALAEAERRLLSRFSGVDELVSEPRQAAWREAYRSLGVSHSKYPNAAAAIGRRVLKQGRIPRINWAVDQCNAASLNCSLPVAACALDRLPSRALEVRASTGTEAFRPIGGDLTEHPHVGEIIYADATGAAHSRRWNWRQSNDVRTDRSTREAIITVETVLRGDADGAGAVAEALAGCFAPHCFSVATATLTGDALRAAWQ